jgi:hypothetical protein
VARAWAARREGWEAEKEAAATVEGARGAEGKAAARAAAKG